MSDADTAGTGHHPELHVDLPATLAATSGGPDGAVWSLPHGGDLDANLVRLGPGGEVGAHRNREVDVLIVVVAGDGSLTVDGHAYQLRPGVAALVPVGADRHVLAGGAGLAYLTVHRRRGPLTIRR